MFDRDVSSLDLSYADRASKRHRHVSKIDKADPKLVVALVEDTFRDLYLENAGFTPTFFVPCPSLPEASDGKATLPLVYVLEAPTEAQPNGFRFCINGEIIEATL